MRLRIPAALAIALLVAGCGSAPRHAPVEPGSYPPPPPGQQPPRAERPPAAAPDAPRRGGYYKDDGPGDSAPPNLEQTPDAVPRNEPLHRFANRPYEVFGRQYIPVAQAAGFRQRGLASWYGRRYHGQRTSSGEPYDMYAMTAAHPTLPIPSYVRVTSVANGRSVVVRVNDRGPFHAERIIDLSYTAALKLGYIDAGSTLVDVETVQAGSVTTARAAAAPAEPRPVTRVAPPDASEPKGSYLQLGAFSARDNAESFRARVYRDLPWLNDVIHVVGSAGPFRLHLGPYSSADDARRIADRIQAELNLAPLLLTK
jgi:rare lipoprotein A